jgi:hypothetical protein
MSIALPAFK